MNELFLKFTDENGDEQRIPVAGEEFVIGRHSENDLSVADSRLSRQQLKIQRFADVFVVSDLDSSNGTKLNGEDLDEPVAIKNGDTLNLGGGLKVEIELISDDPNAQNVPTGENAGETGNEDSATGAAAAPARGVSGSGTSTVSNQTGGGSGLGKALIIAPVLGLILIVFAIGGLFLLGGKSDAEIARNNRNNDPDFISSPIPDDRDKNDDRNDPDESVSNDDSSGQTVDSPPSGQDQTAGTNSGSGSGGTTDPVGSNDGSTDITQPTTNESGDTEKIRVNSFKFMRKISESGQKPVLLSSQLAILEKKINQFKNSAALAGNIQNARSSAGDLQALARSKGLNPYFLAAAAMAKIGNNRSSVIGKAQEMADVLGKLRIDVNNERADDNLIMIAVYDQGARGDTTSMDNKMQKLTAKYPDVRPIEIRTIWFLREKGEISNEQFDLALTTLAIGTITQNPKAFNVSSEALTFK